MPSIVYNLLNLDEKKTGAKIRRVSSSSIIDTPSFTHCHSSLSFTQEQQKRRDVKGDKNHNRYNKERETVEVFLSHRAAPLRIAKFLFSPSPRRT